jgi:RNA polymerase-binding transcription factor DksA
MAARSTTAKKKAGAVSKKPSSKQTSGGGRTSTAAKTTTQKKKASVTKSPPKKAAAKAPAKKVPAKKATAAAKKASPAKSSSATATKEAPAKPKKSPFPAKWLAQQEEALRTERATYTRQATTLRAEADSLVADFEPGDVQFDEESGEGDTLNIERERDLALSAQAQQAVEEIDHALSKFADGTYGLCEVSGEPIPVERLEAIPWARERVEYKIGGLGRR